MTRDDMEKLKNGSEMRGLINEVLVAGGPKAVRDMDYYLRLNRPIKAMIEEYEPLADYVGHVDPLDTLKANLTSHGTAHDAEIWMENICMEKVQIVHGTETYSDALKREALVSGEVVMADSEYQRDKKSGKIVEKLINLSPCQFAEKTAKQIISQIEMKIAKTYAGIDVLLVKYNSTTSPPAYVNVHAEISTKVESWIASKSNVQMQPFRKIVLINDRGQIIIWNL